MKERQPNEEKLINLENFLFSLQRLEQEGKKTNALQNTAWEEIKRIIEERIDETTKEKRLRKNETQKK